jgi:hypothetical protein
MEVLLHLTSVVAGLLERDRAQSAPAEGTPEKLTAPMPDVRVDVNTVVLIPREKPAEYIRLVVQNHSPIPVFIAGITNILRSGKGLYPPRDAVTGTWQTRQRLESGESFQFFLNGHELLASAASDEMEYVSAGALGRGPLVAGEDLATLALRQVPQVSPSSNPQRR